MASAAAALALWTGGAAAIVGGEGAPELGRHAVMILGSKGSFCTAAVVAPDAVLTAGHCMTGSSDYRVHWRDAAGAPVMAAPRAIALHPRFDRAAVKARRASVDLALVRLAEPLPEGFTPLPLGEAMPGPGESWTVAGYGLAREGEARSSGTLRKAPLSVIEPYGRSTILVWLTDPRTGRSRAGAGACTGDSGGLVLDPTGALGAIAVWAEGVGGAGCGALTQGALIAPQRGWIATTLATWRRERR